MDTNQEHLHSNPERGIEASESASERLEKLKNTLERSPESFKDTESRAENARNEALETAISVESGGKEKEITKDSSVRPRRGPIGKAERDKSYKQTMKNIQSELPIASRTFSKVIHNKAIDKASDFLGNTIARPSSILAGAFMAFILTLLTYTVAKTIGYTLSGSETIVAFILGWIIGIIYDYLKVLFTGKKY